MTTQTDWTEMTTPKQYNILTLPQKLKLIDFLRATTYEDGTSVKQIAEDATKVVGFKVTTFNVRGTAEAAEIELPLARAPKIDPMDELRAAIITLEQRVEALEKAQEPEDFNQLFRIKSGDTEAWPAGSDQAA